MSFQDKNIMLKGTPTYSAYEKDIAVVNLYFGDSTVFGNKKVNKVQTKYCCCKEFCNIVEMCRV